MKNPKLTALLVLLLVGLFTVATTPHGAYTVFVEFPGQGAAQFEKDPEQLYWSVFQRLANDQDTDAMLILGRRMMDDRPIERFGVLADPRAGEALIRKAADLGHLFSRVELWNMHGGSADELYEFLPNEFPVTPEMQFLNWHEPVFEQCHLPLFYKIWGYSTQYLERRYSNDPEFAAQEKRFIKTWMSGLFEENCGVSPVWPEPAGVRGLRRVESVAP